MLRRPYPPLDNSVTVLEVDEIEGPSPFMDTLRNDMSTRSIADLTKHYPELHFRFVPGRKRPKGFDLVETCPRGHVAANWRTAALP